MAPAAGRSWPPVRRLPRSAEYQEWRRLLHHFYDPFPAVLHFEPVAEVGTEGR